MTALSIAILGTRGIPARYGGFETFAEQLSTRLVERGHHVTVYGRKRFFTSSPNDRYFRGVNLVDTSTVMQKYLETPVHALTSIFHAIRQKYDVILLCNAANSPLAWPLRLVNVPLIINVDGIERHRKKWNSIGKLWYRIGEWCSVRVATRVVSDAAVISDYYRETYGCETEMIPYGAEAVRREPSSTMKSFGLLPKKYLLYVSRLEPENNALGVIQAYCRLDTHMPLVIVGDAPYADQYKNKLREAADERVVFTGFQFGEAYQELQSNCYLYIQATEVGGTHPALIEAMAYANCVVANGTPENIEVLGDAGTIYPKNDFEILTRQLQELIKSPEDARRFGESALLRAGQKYSWDAVVEKYERLFGSIV